MIPILRSKVITANRVNRFLWSDLHEHTLDISLSFKLNFPFVLVHVHPADPKERKEKGILRISHETRSSSNIRQTLPIIHQITHASSLLSLALLHPRPTPFSRNKNPREILQIRTADESHNLKRERRLHGPKQPNPRFISCGLIEWSSSDWRRTKFSQLTYPVPCSIWID